MQITLDPHPGCGSCQARLPLPTADESAERQHDSSSTKTSCGGLFSDWFDQRAREEDRSVVVLPRLTGIRVGEPVRVDIAPRLALQLAFVAYCLPIVALITGALLSRFVLHWWPDLAALLALDLWLAPFLAATGFIGGLIAYKPLYTYLTGRAGTESSPPLNASRMIVTG